MEAMNNTTLEEVFKTWTTMKGAADLTERDHSTIRYWADTGKIRSFSLALSNIRVVNIEEVVEYSKQAQHFSKKPKKEIREKRLKYE